MIIPTAKPVVINEGTTLGAFTSMEGISCIHEHDSTPVSKDSQPQDDAASHVDLSNSNVTADQQQALKYLLNKYRDVFALTPDELGGGRVSLNTQLIPDTRHLSAHGLTASQKQRKLQSKVLLLFGTRTAKPHSTH